MKYLEDFYKPEKAFRIERRKEDGEEMFDIIWQANGKDEEIWMLIDKKDLEQLESDVLIANQRK